MKKKECGSEQERQTEAERGRQGKSESGRVVKILRNIWKQNGYYLSNSTI